MKLADFGVATKLNEADVNTHSVVGTPYWMAPEVLVFIIISQCFGQLLNFIDAGNSLINVTSCR